MMGHALVANWFSLPQRLLQNIETNCVVIAFETRHMTIRRANTLSMNATQTAPDRVGSYVKPLAFVLERMAHNGSPQGWFGRWACRARLTLSSGQGRAVAEAS
jgi:hypothetical protein